MILEHLQKKFNDPTITNLQKLTKLQAQTVQKDGDFQEKGKRNQINIHNFLKKY